MPQPLRCTCGQVLTARDVVSPGVARCSNCGKAVKIGRPQPRHRPPDQTPSGPQVPTSTPGRPVRSDAPPVESPPASPRHPPQSPPGATPAPQPPQRPPGARPRPHPRAQPDRPAPGPKPPPAAAPPAPAKDAAAEDTIKCPRCGHECGISEKECPRCSYDFIKGGGAFVPYVEVPEDPTWRKVVNWFVDRKSLVITVVILLVLLVMGYNCKSVSNRFMKIFEGRPINRETPETPETAGEARP